MGNKEDYFNIFPSLKSKDIEKYMKKDNITWLEHPGEVPQWLEAMFKSRSYKSRMEILKKINTDSMNCRVENN